MSEELTLTIGTPEVYRAEIEHGMVATRAAEIIPSGRMPPGGLSIHYAEQCEDAPRLGERLLVAVLAGVYPQWIERSVPHETRSG